MFQENPVCLQFPFLTATKGTIDICGNVDIGCIQITLDVSWFFHYSNHSRMDNACANGSCSLTKHDIHSGMEAAIDHRHHFGCSFFYETIAHLHNCTGFPIPLHTVSFANHSCSSLFWLFLCFFRPALQWSEKIQGENSF